MVVGEHRTLAARAEDGRMCADHAYRMSDGRVSMGVFQSPIYPSSGFRYPTRRTSDFAFRVALLMISEYASRRMF